MFKSIRWRLVLSHTLLTLLAVGLVGGVTYKIVDTTISSREIQGLRASAQAVAAQAEGLMWPVLNHQELAQLAQTAAFLEDVRVRILDADQAVVVDSGRPDQGGQVLLVLPFGETKYMLPEVGPFEGIVFYRVGPHTEMHLPDALLEQLPGEISVTVIQRGEGLWGRHISFGNFIPIEELPVEIQAEKVGGHRSPAVVSVPVGEYGVPRGYVELSNPPDYRPDVLNPLRQALMTAGGGALVIAGVLGLWTSHRMAAPLKKLAQISAQMGAEDLSVRAEIHARGEIGELATQFNHMAERLEASFRQLAEERDTLRRFITDASHELRTPITALKNFNTLLQGEAQEDVETRAEFLQESQVQIERLNWITTNLLDLSRLDAGLLEMDLREQELQLVLAGVVSTFAPRAEAKGVQLIIEDPQPDTASTLTCDRAWLEMALSNLLDNALKFTPQGGLVQVGAQDVDGIQIWVRDNGVGIQPEDLPHVTERFYRGQGQVETGSGLGLAIVKSIVEAQGGQVVVTSHPGEGTEVRLVWPQQDL